MHSAEPSFDPKDQISQDEMWRREVASRLNNYRARRRNKSDDDASMRLDFDAAEQPSNKNSVAADTDFYRRANATFESSFDIPLAHATPVADLASPTRDDADWLYTGHPTDARSSDLRPGDVAQNFAPDAPADLPDDPDFDFNRAPILAPPEPVRPESNVIVFPKPVYQPPPPEPVYELGEPMIERPRILEVAEESAPTIHGPLFADIRLEEEELPYEPQPPVSEFEIPLQVAMIPVRVYAGLVDTLFVVIASAIFGAVTWQMIPDLPHNKSMLGGALALPAVFWCIYQYLLLVYAGATAGMQLAGIRLSTFDGRMPNFAERRTRACSMMLSCMSVGLGFAWAAIDQDMLCWHDRISRTYVTQRQ